MTQADAFLLSCRTSTHCACCCSRWPCCCSRLPCVTLWSLCICLCPDIRANENPSLTAVHTLFIREHNRLAGRVAAANPTWTDDQIFQAARRYVIALLQHITYDEYLPALLGSPLPGYTGYKAGVNPTIATEFSTVGFRVGHSMVNSDQKFMDDNGNEVAQVCLRVLVCLCVRLCVRVECLRSCPP